MITKVEFERVYREAGAAYVGDKPPLPKLVAALTEAGMEWGEEPAEPLELLPCPACDCTTIDPPEVPEGAGAGCNGGGCCMIGPCDDPTGAKWNALPRRTLDSADGLKTLLRLLQLRITQMERNAR